ncbi:MAG: hypothetical protein UV74_C0001G0035 [Candidatus Woesebacteria bacterium GW2011_GWB1_43_14]|uniref:Uncharacterized protein n=1 Tax=Candidatus Woesebacteria bacterium GW2011_GWB1_43_14 TaxID=1618578 RepID=A0A0G1DM15_9BACT|nr:MAG: hypothetical protein UT21_C0003G0004 [Candidatus Woesebacteria bacterium GW2011_GWA1_39_11b]KKS78188.1 MAG: hypothetical protein UV51_C0002G0024 [Candidatus Woesebacteria bacterium GW2011_GWC1_42_9]KKS98925.1 MAG: hypothetical protein UV74_C0001G0035 [Candidatus Woesebacteria bacterium GW2011_GWB1_43_14]
MIWNDDLELIFQEYLPKYQSELKSFKTSNLKQLILKASKEAKKHYEKLPKIKTCSSRTYIKLWTRDKIAENLASKTIKKVSLSKPSLTHGASVKYYSLIPYEMHYVYRKELFDANPKDREKVWKSFGLSETEIENKFRGLVVEHIDYAIKKRFPSYVEMVLEKDKISHSTYKCFTKNINRAISYCNQHLPKDGNLPNWFYSKFNMPCYVCRLSQFPFNTQDEVLDSTIKERNILKKYKDKIIIKHGNFSRMRYQPEFDSFDIEINNNGNFRHQSLDLIHELGHTINYLNYFKKGIDPREKSAHEREKETFIIEFNLKKSISLSLYYASLDTVLLTLRRALFEIGLYSNPDQNLRKLYADTFNQCFNKAKQTSNPLFFLDDRISLKPLSSLPHAIALTEILNKD